MGCTGSSPAKADGTVKKIRKPKPWKHPQPITKSQLMQLREEFWDTAPHYGGRKGHRILTNISLVLEIWDALRAAAEADLNLAQAVVDSAGVIIQSADLTVCYDERGSLFAPFLFPGLPVWFTGALHPIAGDFGATSVILSPVFATLLETWSKMAKEET
nr:ubiquitin domain-containing protein 1-like [Ipomoea batatas]